MADIILKKIRIENYLGVGPLGVDIEVGDIYTVLCGPNNSGKTVIAKSLDVLSRLLKLNKTTTRNWNSGGLDLIFEENNRNIVLSDGDYHFDTKLMAFGCTFEVKFSD